MTKYEDGSYQERENGIMLFPAAGKPGHYKLQAACPLCLTWYACPEDQTFTIETLGDLRGPIKTPGRLKRPDISEGTDRVWHIKEGFYIPPHASEHDLKELYIKKGAKCQGWSGRFVRGGFLSRKGSNPLEDILATIPGAREALVG